MVRAQLTRSGPAAEIDEVWALEAERRLAELRSGKAEAIPGEQVMAELRQRFGHRTMRARPEVARHLDFAYLNFAHFAPVARGCRNLLHDKHALHARHGMPRK